MRLALGRALIPKPDVLLLDEPLSNLDAKLREMTRAEIIKLQRALQSTILYATHDTQEAMAIGHRVAVLRDGALLQADTPQAIYDRPANMFVGGFVGRPAMNFFRADLRRSGDQVTVDTGAFSLPVPAAMVLALQGYQKPSIIVGLRPDDLHDRAVVPPGPDLSAVRMQVNVVEYLGRDVLVYLIAGAHTPTARLDARTSVRAGDELDLVLDTSRVHLFDPDTQQALAGPVQPLRWGLDLGARPV